MLPTSTNYSRISRLLHRVADATSRAGVAAVVAIAVLAYLAVLAVADFPSGWQSAFHTASAAVTLVMVFVIQHTQVRRDAAMQLKLDELIRASPTANDLLVHVEAANDDELVEHERRVLDHHTAVRHDSTDADE